MNLWAHAQAALPHHAISRLVGRLARCQWRPFAKRLNRWFAHAYRLDLSDAQRTRADDYTSFNDMFTRRLREGARPMHGDERTIVSPVDGTLSEFGPIDDECLLQAKGRAYTLTALLADERGADEFRGGSFATIYLAPYDYHRIHMPSAGSVRHMALVPGRLFSVNLATAAAVDGLFARNERVVTTIDGRFGRFALVAVGALNVGSIATDWHGVVTPPAARKKALWRYDDTQVRERGAPWGHFNLGSTVILIWPAASMALAPDLQSGQTLRVGQTIGQWNGPATAATLSP